MPRVAAKQWLVPLIVLASLIGTLPATAQVQPEGTYDSANFTLTWVNDPTDPSAPDLGDADGNSVPDAVERMAAAFEAARAFLIQELGYKPPPVAGRYQLYVGDPGGRGYTQPIPGGVGRSEPSFIVIPPEFVQGSQTDGLMRVFAVHEFFHAIQLGYDSEEQHWITEASSTWVEDLFVDELDPNHFFLRDFLPYPRTSLTQSGGGHEYGAWLFLQFLAERYGGGSVAGAGVIRELWELMAVPEAVADAPNMDAVSAVSEVLARRGTSLAAAWGEFLLWQRRLRHFEEGASYLQVMKGTEWPELLRSTTVRSESCRLDVGRNGVGLPPLSGDYVALTPGKRVSGNALLTVEGPAGASGAYFIKNRGQPATEHVLNFDAGGIARADVSFGSPRARGVTVALGNAAPSGEEVMLAYSLRLPGRNKVSISGPRGGSEIPYGTAVRVSGEVECRREPAPFADVVITETALSSGATRAFTTATDEDGTWSALITPGENATYSAKVVDPLLSQAHSSSRLPVSVRVVVSLDISQNQIPAGDPVGLAGDVFPLHPGVPVVIEYRRPERPWQQGTETNTDVQSHYATSLVLPATGIWEVRARVPSTNDMDHTPGDSAPAIVDVQGS
jgi:hypothetical protein